MQVSLQFSQISKQKCLKEVTLKKRCELRRLILDARKLGTTDCVTVFRDGSWIKHSLYHRIQNAEAIKTFNLKAICYFPGKEITLFFKQLFMEINN